MSPRLRKLVLTAHISASVGWFGAIVVFLALAIAGLASDNAEKVRAVYLAMDVMGRSALVPLALASLVTGLVQSLTGPWGLFRHYWVIFKLLINVFATLVLVLYTQTLAQLADIAEEATSLNALRTPSPLLHACAALLLLLTATILAVYKPRGLTPYGRRRA